MRELEIKAWDIKSKRWVFVDFLNFKQQTLSGTVEKTANGNWSSVYRFDDVIFSYSTEQKDINNDEIFEYYIVEVNFAHPPFDNFIGVVIFNEGQWLVDNGKGCVPLWSETNEVKILGNKFEHGYLIK